MVDDNPDILVAKVVNVRSVVTVLKAIAFKGKAICEVTEKGLKFTTEGAAHTVQAHAYLESKTFDEYRFMPGQQAPALANDHLDDDEGGSSVIFSIELDDTIECLTIFGGSSLIPFSGKDHQSRGDAMGTAHPRSMKSETVVSLKMTLKRSIEELTLILEENGVMTVCRIPTSDAEINVDFVQEFKLRPLISKLIVSSEWLKFGFSDIDKTAEFITLQMSPHPPQMRISATTPAGEAQLDFPKGSEVVEAFHCEKGQEYKYKYSMIEPFFKALAVSTKTAIKMNEMGFLSMQFLIPIAEDETCFVEYLCLAMVNIDDETLCDD
ncbi:hypothetical protein SeMB42_g07523 [Synchytrium endobioticum]|uniref:Proliferating cell nuclear antigen n=1 Tax=Synchytrium endobioticum TaxID=286115 RepID=A0A507C132_9FUNG|nr:hypothetical protein SeMB42_g07523 [Synchytrium endobioticum]TPX40025.1 hypothetical protein SeLEV6574_g06843 [Synchytrium endobioticum]